MAHLPERPSAYEREAALIIRAGGSGAQEIGRDSSQKDDAQNGVTKLHGKPD
jgi:hypothetical protein